MIEQPDRAQPDKPAMAWRDPSLSTGERVADLLNRMTVQEKVGQLCSYWAAPLRPAEPVRPVPVPPTLPLAPLEEVAAAGLGQLTRVYGTEPVLPAAGVERLRSLQETVMAANRFGIPALVHEECLIGLLACSATVFPTPLAWGASFDTELVGQVATAIGGLLRRLGVHIGLAPLLGAAAIGGILSGRVDPTGRLPVSVPRYASGQLGPYLQAPLAGVSEVSNVDPSSLYAFGHGLTWTTFSYTDLAVDADVVPTDGTVRVSATVRNDGQHAGTEVVQLYLSDPAATVVRPSRWLSGWARVRLEPGQATRVEFTVHADRTSFTDRGLRRIVEPGTIEVAVGRSSEDLPLNGSFQLSGRTRILGSDRVLIVPVRATPC